MDFDPQKFFIGVVDFFAVLVPGGVVVFVLKDQNVGWFRSPYLDLETGRSWMVFLFASYLTGQFAFLLGSFLLDDRLYKWLTARTQKNDALARLVFKEDPDEAGEIVERLQGQALSRIGATRKAVNAFQWSKVYLSLKHAPALVVVNRFEADSKFFRSFTMILAFLAIYFVFSADFGSALLCLLLGCASVWRYADQRFKASQHAFWSVITIEAAESRAG